MVLRSDRLLDDLAAQKASARAQLGLVSLQKEGVEAAAVFHRAQGSSRNAEAETLAESVGNQRDMAQVRQELALRLVVCVAHIVARLDALAGQFATTGHGTPIFSSLQDNTFPAPKPAAVRLAFLESRGSIVTLAADVKPNLPFSGNSVAKRHDLQAIADG